MNEEDIGTCCQESIQIQKVSLSKSEFPADFISEANEEICEAIRVI